MWRVIAISVLCSAIPVSILGVKYMQAHLDYGPMTVSSAPPGAAIIPNGHPPVFIRKELPAGSTGKKKSTPAPDSQLPTGEMPEINKPPEWDPNGTWSQSGSTGSGTIMLALGVVGGIFFMDVGILWTLKKLGPEPLKADVNATIQKFGGNITIAGGGLVGCFLAIASFALGGLYLVTHLMEK